MLTGGEMNQRKAWTTAVVIVAVLSTAAYWSVQVRGQAPAGAMPVTAEIRDAVGQVILRGQFAPDDDDDDDEWRAVLEGTGADADAAGVVQVERSRTNQADSDVEFSLANVPGETAYTLAIDGVDLVTVRVGAGGRVSVDLDTDGDDD